MAKAKPFRSKAQIGYLYANQPKVASKLLDESINQGVRLGGLPYKVGVSEEVLSVRERRKRRRARERQRRYRRRVNKKYRGQGTRIRAASRAAKAKRSRKVAARSKIGKRNRIAARARLS